MAAGVVGGPSLPLPPGTYGVEVLSDPPTVFDDVRIGPGEGFELTVGDGRDWPPLGRPIAHGVA